MAAMALLVLVSIQTHKTGPAPTLPFNPPAEQAPAPAPSRVPAYGEPLWTGGAENAENHWQKHGYAFPQFTTRDAYIAGAHAFIDHPPPGTLTKQRDNGDTLFYNPDSNTFAVRASNGAPRTFFKPDKGMGYWERQ